MSRFPSKVISPDVVRTSPRIVFSNVDFPAPFPPRMLTISPAATSKLTSKSTGRLG